MGVEYIEKILKILLLESQLARETVTYVEAFLGRVGRHRKKIVILMIINCLEPGQFLGATKDSKFEVVYR